MINLKKEKVPERKRQSDSFKPLDRPKIDLRKPSDRPKIDFRKHFDSEKQISLRS